MNLEIIAHRGYSAIAPENTLIAFQKALDNGAHSLEFDLQLSADGTPVVFHDPSLERIAKVSGTIHESKLAQIKQLDAGKWFDNIYSGITIPTLTEVLEIAHKVPKYLYLDVKNHHPWSEQGLRLLVRQLQGLDSLDKIIVTSFDESFLARCHQLDSRIQIGYFFVEHQNYSQQIAKCQQVNSTLLSVHYSLLLENTHLIQTTRSQGIDLVVWTVDEQAIIQKLTSWGVNRIISNNLAVFY